MNEQFQKEQVQVFPDVDIQVFDDEISEAPIIEYLHAKPHQLSALLAVYKPSWRIEITGYHGEQK